MPEPKSLSQMRRFAAQSVRSDLDVVADGRKVACWLRDLVVVSDPYSSGDKVDALCDLVERLWKDGKYTSS